jgi:hypothetical protein
MVWMIHGLEGTTSGWEPISKKNFEGILAGVAAKDIWVGTFLEVGSYFMGAKILEKVVPTTAGNERTYHWTLPEFFPPHVILKVRLKGAGEVVVRQDGKRIYPDDTGLYSVDLDQKALSLRRK